MAEEARLDLSVRLIPEDNKELSRVITAFLNQVNGLKNEVGELTETAKADVNDFMKYFTAAFKQARSSVIKDKSDINKFHEYTIMKNVLELINAANIEIEKFDDKTQKIFQSKDGHFFSTKEIDQALDKTENRLLEMEEKSKKMSTSINQALTDIVSKQVGEIRNKLKTKSGNAKQSLVNLLDSDKIDVDKNKKVLEKYIEALRQYEAIKAGINGESKFGNIKELKYLQKNYEKFGMSQTEITEMLSTFFSNKNIKNIQADLGQQIKKSFSNLGLDYNKIFNQSQEAAIENEYNAFINSIDKKIKYVQNKRRGLQERNSDNEINIDVKKERDYAILDEAIYNRQANAISNAVSAENAKLYELSEAAKEIFKNIDKYELAYELDNKIAAVDIDKLTQVDKKKKKKMLMSCAIHIKNWKN